MVAFMVILTTYLPLLQKNLPTYVGSPHFYAAIWFASVLFFYSRLVFQKYILYLLLYGLVFMVALLNTLWVEMSEWNKTNLLEEYYILSVGLTIIMYFIVRKDYEGLAWLVKWALIFIGITAIMSIYSASINPMYARNMLGSTWKSVHELEFFNRLGGGSYGYAAGLVGLFPIMVYYYRNNSKSIYSRKVILLYGVLCLFTLIKIQIFANIIISAVIIILSLLGRKRMRQNIIVISTFIILFFVIPKSLYADLLLSLSSNFDPNSETYYKLTDMSKFLRVGDFYGSGTGGRVARYPLLYEALSDQPILGYFSGDHTKDIDEGGHLYWMNRLAIFGIVGFIFYFIFHLNFVKSMLKYFNEEYTFYYLVSVFAFFGLGLMKALAGREFWYTYFILLPGLYFFPLLKNKVKKNHKL